MRKITKQSSDRLNQLLEATTKIVSEYLQDDCPNIKELKRAEAVVNVLKHEISHIIAIT